MSVSLRINEDARAQGEWDQQGINQAIDRRRRAGERVCVQVIIKEPCANMVLASPTCAGAGGGRAPNACEARIFDLWNRLHLNRIDFPSGGVIAFMKQVVGLLK